MMMLVLYYCLRSLFTTFGAHEFLKKEGYNSSVFTLALIHVHVGIIILHLYLRPLLTQGAGTNNITSQMSAGVFKTYVPNPDSMFSQLSWRSIFEVKMCSP